MPLNSDEGPRKFCTVILCMTGLQITWMHQSRDTKQSITTGLILCMGSSLILCLGTFFQVSHSTPKKHKRSHNGFLLHILQSFSLCNPFCTKRALKIDDFTAELWEKSIKKTLYQITMIDNTWSFASFGFHGLFYDHAKF